MGPIGWIFGMAHRVYGIGCHISATNLSSKFSPANWRVALASSNLDNKVWNSAYNEEYNSLQGLEVFTEIITTVYLKFVQKYGDNAQAITIMNVFTISQIWLITH